MFARRALGSLFAGILLFFGLTRSLALAAPPPQSPVTAFLGTWQSQNPNVSIAIDNRGDESRFFVTINIPRGGNGSKLCWGESPCEYMFGMNSVGYAYKAGKFSFNWSRDDGSEVDSTFSLLANGHLLYASTITNRGRFETISVELTKEGSPLSAGS